MTTINVNKISPKNYEEIEYRMSATLAKALLKERKGEDSHLNPQEYLCKYVNEECKIKGNCTYVSTTL